MYILNRYVEQPRVNLLFRLITDIISVLSLDSYVFMELIITFIESITICNVTFVFKLLLSFSIASLNRRGPKRRGRAIS